MSSLGCKADVGREPLNVPLMTQRVTSASAIAAMRKVRSITSSAEANGVAEVNYAERSVNKWVNE
jgi:hypothetical protein